MRRSMQHNVDPESPTLHTAASPDEGDPGRYDPHSSVTSTRGPPFGYKSPPRANLLAMTSEGKRKGRGHARETFGGTSTRRLVLDLLGESPSPGPGAYLPASTFGKHAKFRDKASKGPSPAFRSTSSQRPRAQNQHVPGPGAHSPERAAVEPNARNPAMHLLAKSGRFGTVSQRKLTDTPDVVGPGTYNEHKHRTVAQDAARQVKMMSRQSPGFGVASAAHALPHEEEIEETSGSPGPGTYETDKSELAKANGHPSAFKLPTERKKLRNMVAPTRGAPPKSKRKPAADASSPDGAIRV